MVDSVRACKVGGHMITGVGYIKGLSMAGFVQQC